MRQRSSVGNQRITLIPADKTIEETVAMNVARFPSAVEESDSSQPVNCHPHSRPAADGGFNLCYCPEARRTEHRRAHEQHRVENERRARNSRQPFQSANDELKDQSAFGSTGARSATDGPFNTFPRASNREPWQGQSHVVSVRFQCTMHFKCGHTAVISWSAPDSSR